MRWAADCTATVLSAGPTPPTQRLALPATLCWKGLPEVCNIPTAQTLSIRKNNRFFSIWRTREAFRPGCSRCNCCNCCNRQNRLDKNWWQPIPTINATFKACFNDCRKTFSTPLLQRPARSLRLALVAWQAFLDLIWLLLGPQLPADWQTLRCQKPARVCCSFRRYW